MNRYFIALFISIFIHLFLILLFFYISNIRNEVKITPNKKKVISVSLKSYQKIQSSVTNKIMKPKERKRVEKKKKQVIKKQKVIPKRVVKKVKSHKKEVKTKKIPIKKEPVVEEKHREAKRVTTMIKQQKLKNMHALDVVPQKQQLSAQEVYINENLEKIRVLIQNNLYYPRSARRRGIVGKVVISLILSKNSKIKSLDVISSQHSILSRAAIKTIRSIEDDLPSPQEEMKLEIPIIYSLE